MSQPLGNLLQEFTSLLEFDPQFPLLPGLSRGEIVEHLRKPLGVESAYIPDDILTLCEWSNGLLRHEFAGAMYEGIHSKSIIGPFKDRWAGETRFNYFFAAFSDGMSFQYLLPIPSSPAANLPVYFSGEDAVTEICFDSLSSLFETEIACRERGRLELYPFTSQQECIEIARFYNPGSEFWKRGGPLYAESI